MKARQTEKERFEKKEATKGGDGEGSPYAWRAESAPLICDTAPSLSSHLASGK